MRNRTSRRPPWPPETASLRRQSTGQWMKAPSAPSSRPADLAVFDYCVADTKQTKSVGEHHMCAMLARLDWAPALTRDGLARTDILAVHTDGDRPMIEVQVKSIRGASDSVSWPLGPEVSEPGCA